MPSNQPQVDSTQAEVLARVPEFAGLPTLASKFAPVQKVRGLHRRVRLSGNGFRLENLLEEMRIELRVDKADIARVPASGPVVVVANHPFGMLDGVALAVMLRRVRSDVKVMTNFLLGDVPELKQHCIFVDPLETDRTT